jgi:hypothetical protein
MRVSIDHPRQQRTPLQTNRIRNIFRNLNDLSFAITHDRATGLKPSVNVNIIR